MKEGDEGRVWERNGGGRRDDGGRGRGGGGGRRKELRRWERDRWREEGTKGVKGWRMRKEREILCHSITRKSFHNIYMA